MLSYTKYHSVKKFPPTVFFSLFYLKKSKNLLFLFFWSMIDVIVYLFQVHTVLIWYLYVLQTGLHNKYVKTTETFFFMMKSFKIHSFKNAVQCSWRLVRCHHDVHLRIFFFNSLLNPVSHLPTPFPLVVTNLFSVSSTLVLIVCLIFGFCI